MDTAAPLEILDVFSRTVIGAVFLLVLIGWLWAKPSVDHLLAELARKDDQLAALRTSLDERVIPTIEHNTVLADRVARLLEDRTVTDRRLTETLDRIERGP